MRSHRRMLWMLHHFVFLFERDVNEKLFGLDGKWQTKETEAKETLFVYNNNEALIMCWMLNCTCQIKDFQYLLYDVESFLFDSWNKHTWMTQFTTRDESMQESKNKNITNCIKSARVKRPTRLQRDLTSLNSVLCTEDLSLQFDRSKV